MPINLELSVVFVGGKSFEGEYKKMFFEDMVARLWGALSNILYFFGTNEKF